MTKLDLLSAHNSEAEVAQTTKQKFWRSLDTNTITDQTKNLLKNEFPNGFGPEELAEVTVDGETAVSGFDRREVIKLLGASVAFAGLGAGCIRRPEQEILPYVSQPESVIPGIASYYATSMPNPNGGIGLLVESHEGRPTKIEGNPSHSASRGNAGTIEQASILQMYDPDRSRNPTQSGHSKTWSEWTTYFKSFVAEQKSGQGAGLAFLMSRDLGPAELALRAQVSKVLPKAKFYDYDAMAAEHHLLGAEIAFGEGARVAYDLKKAKVICAFDSNFLVEGPDYLAMADGFAARRSASKIKDADTAHREMNRLYVIEPSFSSTGSNADHRLRVAGQNIGMMLNALAVELKGLGVSLPSVSAVKLRSEQESLFIKALAKDLRSEAGRSLVIVGERQDAQVHAFAQQINEALGAFKSGAAKVLQGEKKKYVTSDQQLAALVADIKSGAVKSLISSGVNPSYTAARDIQFSESLSQLKQYIHLGMYADETSTYAQWHIPKAHYLEMWGSTASWQGVCSIVQPLIQPLFGARSVLDILGAFVSDGFNSYEWLKEYFTANFGGSSIFRTSLHDGLYVEKFNVFSVLRTGTRSQLTSATKQKSFIEFNKDKIDLVLRYDQKAQDGRTSNLSWLQELPDNMSKLCWENALFVGPSLARELNIKSSVVSNSYQADVLEVAVDGQKVEIPAFVLPGMAPYSVEVALGYGRELETLYIANGVGIDVSPLLSSKSGKLLTAKLTRNGNKQVELASTQDHFAIDGDPIQDGKSYSVGIPIQDLKSMNNGFAEKRPLTVDHTLKEYRNDPKVSQKNSLRVFSKGKLVEKDSLKHAPARPDQAIQPTVAFPYDGKSPIKQFGVPAKFEQRPWAPTQQWGMAIDMTACIGCNACVIACQSENNIPVVGRDQVLMGRELHWIRIDRYFTGDVDQPKALAQPVGCLHCENAPCEPVCPVAATVHGDEGINTMVYNRCIGTRYCSNNCPVKVRRFNYFDFSKSAHIYVEATAKKRHKILKLQRNPNVTVRFRGVIEKCTYCTQRIQEAKFKAKREGLDSKNMKDGSVMAACEQTCPTGAIAFGNINDPKSRVSALKTNDRNYEMLSELNIRPRTSYLARIRNLNPELEKNGN